MTTADKSCSQTKSILCMKNRDEDNKMEHEIPEKIVVGLLNNVSKTMF